MFVAGDLPHVAISRFDTLLALVLSIGGSDFHLHQPGQLCFDLRFTVLHRLALICIPHRLETVSPRPAILALRLVNGEVHRVELLEEALLVREALRAETDIELLEHKERQASFMFAFTGKIGQCVLINALL